MMVVTNLAAPHAGEKFLCPVGASAVKRIRFFVIDALHFEPAVKLVPIGGFVGVDHGALGDSIANP